MRVEGAQRKTETVAGKVAEKSLPENSWENNIPKLCTVCVSGVWDIFLFQFCAISILHAAVSWGVFHPFEDVAGASHLGELLVHSIIKTAWGKALEECKQDALASTQTAACGRAASNGGRREKRTCCSLKGQPLFK